MTPFVEAPLRTVSRIFSEVKQEGAQVYFLGLLYEAVSKLWILSVSTREHSFVLRMNMLAVSIPLRESHTVLIIIMKCTKIP